MKSQLLLAALACVLSTTAALAAAPDQAHIISPPTWDRSPAPKSTAPYALTGNVDKRDMNSADAGSRHEVRRLGGKAEYDAYVR